MDDENQPAGIEYHGSPGATAECEAAVVRLLQCGHTVTQARILTHGRCHCLLLTVDVGDLVAIKSGFTSGYGGEGPRGFSFVLQLLHEHGAQLEEYEVGSDLLESIDKSSLRVSDIESLEAARPIRPSRWPEYISDHDQGDARDGTLWGWLPPIMPFSIIDSRIIDLALKFRENPDGSLLKGYRRLEDLVRKRTGIDDYSIRLFTKALAGPTPYLKWEGISEAEREGRFSLFVGVYKAYRNPRAHRESRGYSHDLLVEFLALNNLYRLEGKAKADLEVV